MGISGLIDAFEAASVHTGEIPGLVTLLLDCQYPGGAFSYCYGANTDDEDWQSTAYAVMSLARVNQTTYQTEINYATYWLSDTQDASSGGWVYSNGNHYPEVGGECTAALYFNQQSSTIIVEKQTDPDGAPDTFTFTGNAGGTIPDDGQIVVSGLQPGTYTSTETVPAGWDLTSIACDDSNSTGDVGTGTATFQFEADETVTCTFTNAQRGSITIVKETEPEGGTGFNFSGDLGSFSLDDGDSKVFGDLLPGHYDVTEVVPAGWGLTKAVCTDGTSVSSNPISNGVRVRLKPGGAIVCIFTNVKRGSISIVKETDPDGGTGFDFSGDFGNFSLDDGENEPFTGLSPRDYDVTEAVPTGWDLDSVVCTGGDSDPISNGNGVRVHLDPGEQIVCTFTNVQVSPIPADYFIYLPLIQNNPVVATAGSWGVSLPRSVIKR